MIMKLKRKLLLLTMILTCLCFLATGCNQEEKDAAAPTETKVEEPINEDTADADITINAGDSVKPGQTMVVIG